MDILRLKDCPTHTTLWASRVVPSRVPGQSSCCQGVVSGCLARPHSSSRLACPHLSHGGNNRPWDIVELSALSEIKILGRVRGTWKGDLNPGDVFSWAEFWQRVTCVRSQQTGALVLGLPICVTLVWPEEGEARTSLNLRALFLHSTPCFLMVWSRKGPAMQQHFKMLRGMYLRINYSGIQIMIS